MAFQHPGEAAFEDISNKVPSFAGFFLEGENLVAFVTDPTQAQAAEAEVRRAVADRVPSGAEPRLAHPVVVVRPARHSFRQLRQWRDQIEQQVLLTLPDAAWIDLDEARNQVAIGLADGSGRAEVEKALAQLGVAPEGVRIEITGRHAPNQNLWDRTRPVVGGLAQSVTFNGVPQVFPWCTYSFNATYNGVDVILTTSHCTQITYHQDHTPTVFYQRDVTDSDLVGSEWFDPPAIGDGCVTPLGFLAHCHRYSDAVMIRYESGVSFDLGLIARTTWRSQTWGQAGSTTIDPLNQRFRIVAVQAYPLMGQRVEKVGWATGWTSGIVRHTCVDLLATDYVWRDCSYQADYWSGGGDSGAPVFSWSGSGNDVTLVGIHWGILDYTDFSPWGGIIQDFGSMTAVAYVPPPPLTNYIYAQPPYYYAEPSGGYTPYTYLWEVCFWNCYGGNAPAASGGVQPNRPVGGWQFYSNDLWIYWTSSGTLLRSTVTDSHSQQAVATYSVP